MKKLLFSAILALTLVNLTAQVLTRSTDSQTVDNSIKMNKFAVNKTFNLPKFDVEKMLSEDEVDKAAGLPFRFGHIFEVNLGMENSGEWIEMAEGRVWMLKISSAGAYSINLAYDKFCLPKGSHLYIYNSDKTALQGPITSEHNPQNRQFATDLIPGSAIILEYYEPYGVEEKGVISVSRVVHGYINLFSNNSKGFGSSAGCNIDINCPQGQTWLAESNAVAMIIVGSNRICSGALINNVCQNFIPYLLTANHCIENQNVGNWTFRFGYKSPSCGGGDDYSYYSYFGSTLRANAAISDFALLELSQRPASNTGITFAGWYNQNAASNSGVSITHPRGDVMKIASYNQTITRQTFYNSLDWNVVWENGTVEPISSGGPLFNNEHRIIGQVHGGNPSDICTSDDNAFFGRFDISWNNGLASWLDPNNTGAMTTNTIAIPYISGPSTVCSSNTSFTLSSLPDGTTVNWSHDPNLLTYVSGQGTLTYTVKAVNSLAIGSGWVRATLNGSFCSTMLPDHIIWVGKPSTPLPPNTITIHGAPCVERNNLYLYNLINASTQQPVSTIPGANSYSWSLTPNDPNLTISTINNGQISCSLNISSNAILGNNYTLQLSALNSCGSVIVASKNIKVYNEFIICEDGGSMPRKLSINPNPAAMQINITEVSPVNDNIPWVIRIMSQTGVALITVSTQLPKAINVSNFNRGVYYLHARKGNYYEQQVFVIE